MADITRRDFMQFTIKLTAAMGLGSAAVPRVAEALALLTSKNAPPVIWLQGLSCSGCSVSLLNSENPNPATLLMEEISLLFHSTLSTATGELSMEVLRQGIDKGGYYLVVEGAIPAGMPMACRMGNETVADTVLAAARNAKAVIAVGTCASFGGVAAAEKNPTGAVSLPKFLKDKGVAATVVCIPGCPAHPDWFVGTLVHLLHFGIPPLDDKGRPKMFFSKLIHDQCHRFSDYARERFAKSFTAEGCLFKLGCQGPSTHADCSLRGWNGGVNFCIRAGAPCVGCASEDFASSASFSFFTKGASAEMKKG